MPGIGQVIKSVGKLTGKTTGGVAAGTGFLEGSAGVSPDDYAASARELSEARNRTILSTDATPIEKAFAAIGQVTSPFHDIASYVGMGVANSPASGLVTEAAKGYVSWDEQRAQDLADKVKQGVDSGEGIDALSSSAGSTDTGDTGSVGESDALSSSAGSTDTGDTGSVGESDALTQNIPIPEALKVKQGAEKVGEKALEGANTAADVYTGLPDSVKDAVSGVAGTAGLGATLTVYNKLQGSFSNMFTGASDGGSSIRGIGGGSAVSAAANTPTETPTAKTDESAADTAKATETASSAAASTASPQKLPSAEDVKASYGTDPNAYREGAIALGRQKIEEAKKRHPEQFKN